MSDPASTGRNSSTGRRERGIARRAFSGLAARVAGQLAIALLPIGAIAVYQAWQISHDEAARLETALMSATAEAAAGEALAVANASGAAQALAALVGQTPPAQAHDKACSDIFAATVREVPQYSFAGYIDLTGTVKCGSSAVGQDVRNGAVYPVITENHAPVVVSNKNGPISGTSVIISAAPVTVDGTYVGFVSISVPHTRIRDIVHPIPGEADGKRVVRLVTFNADGAVISSAQQTPSLADALPAGRTLDSLADHGQWTFTDRDQAGKLRSFAVVPIIPGVVYALGSWPAERMAWDMVAPALFPILMLIVGLGGAFWAVDNLAIGRIRELGRHMREFSLNRRVLSFRDPEGTLPREFAEIDEIWCDLAERLLREEAELEGMVHEKNVLLKEVNHRVKNNLQLIVSLVNLKIRRARTPEARRSLEEVRGRVQSIASVHQALYANPTGGPVQADELLADVVDSTITAGTTENSPVEISRRYAPMRIYPDQAVPFLLLASEAVTNALKYVGRPPDGRIYLEISLDAPGDVADEPGRAVFRVVNSRGEPLLPVEQVTGSGLGRSLLSGFATQLGGTVAVKETDDVYDFRLSFVPGGFDPDESADASLADLHAG